MKFFAAFFLLFVFSDSYSLSAMATGILGKVTGEKSGGMFSNILGDSLLKEITIMTDEDMNDRGALKMHLAVIFEKEAGDSRDIYQELSRMSASQYFRSIEQMVKDHPDRIKIYEWELVAKKRLFPPIQIKPVNNMTAKVILIFANYSSRGEHRAQIPLYGKTKITFQRSDFKCEEKEEEEEKEDEEEKEED